MRFFVPARPALSGIVLFVLSLCYLGLEFYFNLSLLDVAGDVGAHPDDIDRLQYLGRSVSSFGFTLLIFGVFARTGFRLPDMTSRISFAGIWLVCTVPMLALYFSGGLFGGHAGMGEIFALILPFFGLFLVLATAGRFSVHVVLGLLMTAAPAMYIGQKQMVETAIVDHATWKDMSNARYMLMLRGGLESCAIELDGFHFCGAAGRASPELKSFRMLMPVLWMLAPEETLSMLSRRKDDIVTAGAQNGLWFSPDKAYQKYAGTVDQARAEYTSAIMRYYKPYRQASDAYLAATDVAVVSARVKAAADLIEQKREDGWQAYRKAVSSYRASMVSAVGNTLGGYAGELRQANDYCAASGDCPKIDGAALARKAAARLNTAFEKQVGYPPDIQSRDAFFKHARTRRLEKKAVEEELAKAFSSPGFALPDGWVYERDGFSRQMADLVTAQANSNWQKVTHGKLPPGLSFEAFSAQVGMPLPDRAISGVMDEDTFFARVVLPKNRQIADQALQKLAAERGTYADDAVGVEEGKNYMRAIYIAPLSLVISLMVVMLTLLRGLSAAIRMAMSRYGDEKRLAVTAVVWLVVASVPFMWGNAYTRSDAYAQSLQAAGAHHPVVALAIDWSLHLQPLVYNTARVMFSKG